MLHPGRIELRVAIARQGHRRVSDWRQDTPVARLRCGGRAFGEVTRMGIWLSEFKTFILRGNVVDLAVAVVIGAAFTAVVNAFVKDIITPIISIPGKADFST